VIVQLQEGRLVYMAGKRVVKLPVEAVQEKTSVRTFPANMPETSSEAVEQETVKTFVPLGIAEGNNPGPTLAVIGAIHASEYAARNSAVRLWKSLDPEELSGTVLVVLAADVMAFCTHHIYTNPVDGKNLNRSFPGKEDGSLAEVLAYTLMEEVVKKADAVIDCHGGEFDEYMAPYVITSTSGDEVLDRKTLDLAYALGIPFIEVVDATGEWLGGNTLQGAAVLTGRPGMVFEVGGRGEEDEQDTAAGFNALQNALKHLGMLPGKPVPWGGKPVWLERGIIVKSTEGGVFERSVMVGDWVEKGDVFGRVYDFDGTLLEEIQAEDAGVVLTVISAPAIKPDGFAGKIGVLPELD
jgi:predicted deacylase